MITPRVPVGAGDVAGHYDELDAYYRKLWGEHLHHGLWTTGRESPEQAALLLIERVLAPLNLRPGDRVCDVGCGYGGTTRYLARERGARVIGLTISRVQYEYAVGQGRPGDDATYLLRNWEHNDLDAGSFDGLVSIECLAHVENKAAFFGEVRRVLRPGGRAGITAWLADEGAGERQRRRLLEPICREGRLPGMGTRREYAELIENAGLRIERFEDLSLQVARTWQVCRGRIVRELLTSPALWRFLATGASRHSVFLLTVGRILRAYRRGAMRYGLFVLESPSTGA